MNIHTSLGITPRSIKLAGVTHTILGGAPVSTVDAVLCVKDGWQVPLDFQRERRAVIAAARSSFEGHMTSEMDI